MQLKDLNPEQLKAVTHKDGPLLIIAGAGTGKTAAITQRIGWLIEQELAKPDEILALTFTDKAAGEMEERVDRLMPYGYVDLWIMTFHSFCQRVLERFALDIGLPNDFKIVDEAEQQVLVRQNFDRFNLSYYKPLGNPTKFIGALLRHISRCKDEAITVGQYASYIQELEEEKNIENDAEETARMREVASSYESYQKLLLEHDALDFGDLLMHTLRLFEERKKILHMYQKQFKYILVDEFQDTNWTQYALVKLLAAPNNNLTVVGDDDQSIYKFRGASVSNILQFKKDYPKSTNVFLTENYRSKQEILDTSYIFIQQNNPDRLEFQMQKENGGKRELSKKLHAQRGEGATIEHVHTRYAHEQGELVAQRIHKLAEKGEAYSDCAILVRANAHADLFTVALDAAGIPYHFFAAKGLYRKPIIRDLFNYAKLLDSYHESSALYHIANLPVFPRLKRESTYLTDYAHKKAISLYETFMKSAIVAQISEETRSDIAALLRLIEKHSDIAKTASVREVFLAFLEDFGYLTALGELSSVKPEREQQVLTGWEWSEAEKREHAHVLEQFFREVQSFLEQDDQPNLKNFLARWQLIMEGGGQGTLRQDPEQESPDRVSIMTVHAAKGLEFDHVFIGSLVDKHFPSTRKSEAIPVPDALIKEQLPDADMHVQEERRLFYVAMTRAKKGLYFLSADDYGGKLKKKLSRFLIELGYENTQPFFGKTSGVEEERRDGSTPDVEEKKNQQKSSSLPTHFSFTQMRAFQSCPLQYKYAHALRVPVRGKPAFSFGKSMHASLQKFFELRLEGKEPDCNELLRILDDVWIDDWYGSQDEQKKVKEKAQEQLARFYEQHEGEWPNVSHIEQAFHIKFGKVTFKGAIDRIDRLPDGKVRLVDYKTGKPKEKLLWDDKEQLFLYQLAAQDVLKEKVGELMFYYLEDGSTAVFKGEEKDFVKLEEKVSTTVEKIQQGHFSPTPSQFTCGFCDFKDICPYRK